MPGGESGVPAVLNQSDERRSLMWLVIGVALAVALVAVVLESPQARI